MFARLAVTLIVAAVVAPNATAQQLDRRARDEPEIVIEGGGRVGPCDVLRFTPQGEFLFAAGDDKVVRVWPHLAAGLDTTPKNTRTLRWRAWRDQRGGIKAASASPDGKRIAVGGFGLKISSVAILERDSGDTLAITWPAVREGQDSFNVVTAVQFHPDGKRVGFGTADGSLWLWDPVKLPAPDDGRVWSAPVRVGKFVTPKNAAGEEFFNFPKAIHFPDANTLVAVAQRGSVVRFDLAGKLSDDPAVAAPTGKTLFDAVAGHAGVSQVFQAAWTDDGAWLAVAANGRLVLLHSADGKRTVKIELPEKHYPRSIAVHPKGTKLAIGVAGKRRVGDPAFHTEGNDEIWVYDNPTAEKLPEPAQFPHPGKAEALAFHPMLNRLAVAGGDADEITLLDLKTPRKPLTVIRGTGRQLFGVNLSENGDTLGVRTSRNPDATDPNNRGAGEWLRFNLPRFTHTPNAKVKWVEPVRTAAGWVIVPDPSDRFVWYAEREVPSGVKQRLRLGLDRDQDQAPTCFTFVPTAAGKPPRVLVGHYYGCSLFELVPERAVKNPRTGAVELPRSKLFTGHGAEVTSVVADRKGEWFVTAAADHTVAGWPLTDWTSQRDLGASFAADAGQLTVSAVDVGSPAWEAGLTKGDRIDTLAIDGRLSFDRRPGKPAAGTVEAALGLLANPWPGIELYFGWSVPGNGKPERRVTTTTIRQRPLWKWFPAFDDRGQLTDTVLWMWHGSYYFTASVHGDRMIGWHVNHADATGRPQYQPLERYKHLFLKPDVIGKLLGTRSVAEALKDAHDGNPQRKSFRDVEPAGLELALGQGAVRPAGVPVSVTVTPLGSNPDYIPERIELWVNDHRYKVWSGFGKAAFTVEEQIPAAAFRSGDNQITVLTTNPARGRAEVTRLIHNPAASGTPTLHGLAIGINDYSAHRKATVAGARAFGDLARARADASDFTETLLKFRGEGKHFPAGELTPLLDAAATRKTLTASLAALKDRGLKPDDLLVVFFAGHGDLLEAGGKPAGNAVIASRGLPADSGTFVLCCPDYSRGNIGTTALSGEELFEALAGLNCRKLVLLDACHAGGAVEANLLRRFIPNGQGPCVIAACDQSEQSFEDDGLGHGVFTYAVLEAFGSRFRAADENSDGKLTPDELYAYVTDRVREVMRQVRPGNTQNPVCFPHHSTLPRFTIVAK